MVNKRLAYLRSSSTWPINLCAAEKMHEVDTPSICGSNYGLITYLLTNSYMHFGLRTCLQIVFDGQ